MVILALDMSAVLGQALHILYAALGLGLVIFFHELGHFAVAKWCGVFVERFSIGFGPILLSYKRGETEYALSAVPFGGYVKMMGQDDIDPSQLTSDEIAQDPRSYSAKSVPQRMAIISAGVIMNIITGLLFFAGAFVLGVDSSPSTVGSVIVGRPAWEHGMQPGDRITRINGRETTTFKDILRGTTLSRGDMRIEGVRADGSTFDLTFHPARDDLRRMIGVGPLQDLSVISATEPGSKEPDRVSQSDSPAAKVAFQVDDRIVEVGGERVESHPAYLRLLARRRGERLDFVVERKALSAASGAGETPVERVTLSVDPWQFRELGLWMDIEQVASVRMGSPAEQGGLKVGDKIISVNGEDVGKKINPLHLPEFFEALAGQPVTVRVKRAVDGSPEPQEVSLTLTPSGDPAWLEHHVVDNTPLAISSIGAGFHLTSNILKVMPDSPAARQQIPEGAALKSMAIDSDDPLYRSSVLKNAPLVISFDQPGRKNVAHAFWRLQEIPSPRVRLTLAGDNGKTFDLTPVAAPDWFLPTRGLYLAGQSETTVAKGWGDALRLAVTETRNNATDNYLTLRNLVSGDLSLKNLHGPVGIAQVAYHVSKQGLSQLLMFLGFLSINLAVLNFLPIPVLDGGHMVFLTWEGVTRRRPSERVLVAATYCGMAFVVGLMLFVICLDLFVHKLGV